MTMHSRPHNGWMLSFNCTYATSKVNYTVKAHSEREGAYLAKDSRAQRHTQDAILMRKKGYHLYLDQTFALGVGGGR